MNFIIHCEFMERMPAGHYKYRVYDTAGYYLLPPEYRKHYGGGYYFDWPFTEWFL
jgi:hypothetical protein